MNKTVNLAQFVFKKPDWAIVLISPISFQIIIIVFLKVNGSSHSGLGIYLHKKITYQKVPIEDTSDIWEEQFIEIGGKHLEEK